MSGFRPKSYLHFLPLVIIGLLTLLVTNSMAAPASSTVAPLQPINVFADQSPGQWNGSGDGKTIEMAGGSLPIDYSQTFNGLPSLRINTSGDTGWWLSILAGSSWESYSIAPYVASGQLEFNIKGNVGGEDFTVAVSDVVFERNPKYCEPVKLQLSNYVTVTTDWQHVSIPLSDLVADGSCQPSATETLDYAGGTFDPTQIYAIVFNGETPGDLQVWINDVEWTSPDYEPVFPPIKVNQLGYTPNSPKYALVSGFSDVMLANAGDTFDVRDSSGSVVYSGALTLVTDNDGATGERILKADFSDFTTAGDYYLTIVGYDDSTVFNISDAAYDGLLYDSMRYFFLQRQGIELSAAHAGVWAHGVGHPQDAVAKFESDPTRTLEGMKGWYDAGDYGKYVNAGATAVSDLLWAYELFPEEFSDNQFNLPESSNGVPDILDEARWELEWMLKMQDTDGGFYHMLKSKGLDGEGSWDSDTTPDVSPDARYIRDSDVAGYGTRTNVKPTSVTASGVAGLAHAAHVFADIDAAFSAELLQAAIAGWGYLDANPQWIDTIKGAPYTIPYEDYTPPGQSLAADHDDRVWAAAALFRATGDAVYRNYFDTNYGVMNTKFLATDENAYGVGNVEIPAVLTYMAADNPTPAVMSDISADFNTWRSHMLDRANNAHWQTTLQDADYYWGSNYPNLTTPLALAVGSHFIGSYDQDIIDLSRQSMNYVLGVNSLQFSYVSGYGDNALERPFSMIYNFDNKPGVPPGIMVGGANEYNNSFLYSNYSQKKYQDNAAAWSTNEHTVYWNAVLVFHAALIADAADFVEVEPPVDPIVDNIATSEQLISGNVTNNYQATWEDDALVQSICEETTNGNPGNRYDFAEHVWQFNVTPGDTVTFHISAWERSETPQDSFVLSYSLDGISYTPMLSVNDTTRAMHDFVLPAGEDGTISVKLTDTDHTPGNSDVECVEIEEMYFRSETVVPTAISIASQTVTNNVVVLLVGLLAVMVAVVTVGRVFRPNLNN